MDDGVGYATNCSDPTGGTVPAERPVALGPELPLPLIRQSELDNRSLILNQPTNLVPLSKELTQFTTDFITRHQDDPFFALVAHPHIHTATPNIDQLGFRQYAGCDFAHKSDRGPIGDAIEELDWVVGEIVGKVEELGLSNRTLFLFTSDNGPWLAQNQGGGSLGQYVGWAAPYMNTGKGSTWEGGIREPAFAYWPGTIPGRTSTSETISSLDILPTLLTLANITLPSNLDGRDASRVFLGTGQSQWRDKLLPFWNGPSIADVGTDLYAGRYNQFKFHWKTSPGLIPGTHYMNVTEHDPPLVFDVQSDPAERYPLNVTSDLPDGVLEIVEKQRADLIASTPIRHIDPRFGHEWALCCDWASNCSCSTPTPIKPSLTFPKFP